ncbi:DUF3307 domain-containing protein [Sutcliffiella rhizosphaerae]|uniref:DUF3307 domain-containing protein n=1 Tax=Sutcliffiella rhizosphaerae TaxID=2880967 RepID=A0ABN8AEL5_9BACI|nr:DUF3307 domain-containing protein [Sutcliffiella rhizosphaerae]CAG9623705.1 hypothetical protein BACCIP111883_04537 [Sutcliffiella rhizosphaerae]
MIVLLLILAHLIADFYLQTEKMVRNKKEYLKLHLLHHTIVTFIVLLFVYFMQGDGFLFEVIIPTGFIVFVHGIVDIGKMKLEHNSLFFQEKNAWKLSLFIGDQLLHILSILLICMIFIKVDLYELFHYILLSLNLWEGARPEHGLFNSMLFLIIMFILCTTVTGHIIRIMLGSLTRHLSLFEGKYTLRDMAVSPNSEKNMTEEYTYMVMKHQDLSRGKVIGYLERLLVVSLILMGSFSAVGFIVAAKSLTRFKQMDDRDWAEYFLLGTLTSFLFAILIGIMLKVVFLG